MYNEKKAVYAAVDVRKSVGKVLMHDITEIVPGKFKGPAFRKGHIIKEEDVEKLRDLGKEQIYAFDMPEDFYHEDEAAHLFKKLAGENVSFSEPSEGKVQFTAQKSGLLLIERDIVDKINFVPGVVLTTLHSEIPVKKGDKLAGVRVVPLIIEKKYVQEAVAFADGGLLKVAPYKKKQVGLIITGSEVASGRIKDGFRPVIEKKINLFGSEIKKIELAGDDREFLKQTISRMVSDGCNFIILTGGMSVDPDDTTKNAIRDVGVEVVSYGAPVLPGNMFMAGYLSGVPVFGVPACALFYNITVLDLFLPYAFADVRIKKTDIVKKGYGGFCRHCDVCVYPNCSFGKC